MNKEHNLRFIRGATHLVVGPSACGKTYRTCEILKNKNNMIQNGENIKNIVLCYAAWQPIYEELDKKGIITKFVQKKPTSSEFVQLVEKYKDNGGSIVVIDDFMTKIDQDMVDIVTVQSRHYNTTTFILFQSLFPNNKLGRAISLNVKYMHIHKNPRENSQIGVLARQVLAKDYQWLVEAYKKITETPYQALLLDMTQECPEHLRVRSHYLPSELPMKVWVKSGTASLLPVL